MGRVAIVGVGHSKFGKRSDASLRELAFEAYSSALDDAELESPAIDGSVVCSATHYDKQRSPAGTSMPAYYAMYANAHMAKYGTTEEDMALVTVKNRKYGAKNPQAMFQKPITAEEVMNSRPVAKPLKLYDCCANADGAACLIVASSERARKITDKPVWIAGLGLASSPMSLAGRRGPFTSFEVTKNAARSAYEMARVKPTDVDVAEVHDSFSITEILNYEDLGFARPGKGTKLLKTNETELGGKIPVNIDGGLISKGHPVGATGASQLTSLVHQLRREAGDVQIDGARIGLAQNIGGIGMYSAVSILRA